MRQMKAMQYYRVWIYACNCVLLISVLLFVAVGSYVFGDVRMSLITGVRYYHPTFLYAYVAVVLQGGVVQVIGCVGAVRLNERLLNVYWLLLLSLLVGDAVVGVVWVFRFQRILTALPEELGVRLATEYSIDPHFTNVWDYVQKSERCCGLRTPEDFAASSWAYRLGLDGSDEGIFKLPSSCCRGKPLSTVSATELHEQRQSTTGSIAPVINAFRKRNWGRKTIYVQRPQPPLHLPTTTEPPPFNGTCVDNDRPNTPFGRGCLKRLLHWYKGRADLLFVLGYCVITFLKVCFIGLLRCEIREMIQKMQVLRCEVVASAGELGGGSGGAVINHATSKGTGGGLLGKISNTTNTHRPRRPLRIQQEDAGNTTDSDTNSHSRLLLGRATCGHNGNNNKLSYEARCERPGETHELQELRPRQHTDI